MRLLLKTLYRVGASQKALLKLFFFGGFLLMLFGRREYQLYHYETVEDAVLDGDLIIEVVPSRKLIEKNGKKLAIEADPYSILFMLFSDVRFKKIEVQELVLTGVSSDKKLKLSSATSLDARKYPDSSRFFAIASFSKSLEGLSLEYEPYDLSATLILTNEDGSKIKSHLGYRLIPKYKSESRSDIVDGMMGI